MQQFKSQFLNELQNRGFISQITHPAELDELLSKQKIAAYIGFDCTAKSLHVGSLIQIMILQILQKHGHTPIVLLGGGTTKIGDPSGKDEARQFLDEQRISENLDGIKKTLSKFDLSKSNLNEFNSSVPSFQFVNNDEWLSQLKYIEFLRDFGRHFSVNKMLTFDSVKLRLDRQQPLSFIEFNYMIFQAYDFYELNKKYACILQIGGSDQWGNIVNGVELTRRKGPDKLLEKYTKIFEGLAEEYPEESGVLEKLCDWIFTLSSIDINHDRQKIEKISKKIEADLSKMKIADSVCADKVNKEINNFLVDDKNNRISHSVFGLTTPLLTTSDGKKMGKTADGAVWLDENMLTPFDYFQYFRNVTDEDVARFLKLFTHEDSESIFNIQKEQINRQKEILAYEATRICHGEEAAIAARTQAKSMFSGDVDINLLPEKEIQFNSDEVKNGKKLIEILRDTALCESGGEAKRLIKGGGVKVDDQKIDDENHVILVNQEQLFFKVSLGKKKIFKINIIIS